MHSTCIYCKNIIAMFTFKQGLYSGRSNDDLTHLDSCILIDEFEQTLHEKQRAEADQCKKLCYTPSREFLN